MEKEFNLNEKRKKNQFKMGLYLEEDSGINAKISMDYRIYIFK